MTYRDYSNGLTVKIMQGSVMALSMAGVAAHADEKPVLEQTELSKSLIPSVRLDESPRRSFRVVQTDNSDTRSAEIKSSKQGGISGETAIDEVVVTAQKRVERLQDVPMSVSVLVGKVLDESSVSGVAEVLNRVPGVVISSANQGGGTQVWIRGVGAAAPFEAGSSPIGYYLDSIPFGLVKDAIAPDSNAFDLERIEVLRGPQGTLYGASAENGLVRVLTRDANLDAFEFKARATASSTQGGGGNYRSDAAVNVPLIEGKLAVRAVVGYEHLSGWINTNYENRANDADLQNYRLKINAQPTPEFSVGLSAWRSRDDYGAPSSGRENSQNGSTVPLPIVTGYDAYGLKLGYEFDTASVSSATSYLDYSNTGYLDLSLEGLPATLFTGRNSHVFSQELIINSVSSSSWHWTVGAFYRDGKDRLIQTLGSFLPAPIDFGDGSKSYAVFGQLGRRFAQDSLEWTLGLRYFHDRVFSGEDVQDQGLDNVPLLHQTAAFNSTTPRAVITWYPDKEATVYASYSQGFRSGFPQNPNTVQSAPSIPPLKPDKLYNYEVGAKVDFLDRRLSLESAIYYMDWQEVQQVLSVSAGNGVYIQALLNSTSASGLGTDLGLTARPIDGLELGVNVSWNDLKLDKPVFSRGVLLLDKGDRLNFSSEWTAGGSGSYTFKLLGATEGRFAASANYSSKQINRTLIGTTPFTNTGNSSLMARTEFSVVWPQHWIATVFVDNATNDNPAAPGAFGTLPDWFGRVRPRTFGAQVDYTF